MANALLDNMIMHLEGRGCDPVQSNAGWKANCPVCEDAKHHLGISTGDDGRILLNCLRGCKTGAIVGALGLKYGDLFPSNGATQKVYASPIDELAARRGWSASAMQLLGAKADGECVSFPMRDASGNQTGDKLRRGDGQPIKTKEGEAKSWTRKGSKNGLIYPVPFPSGNEVVIVEGEADVCAALSAGIGAAVGTPGCKPGQSAMEHLQRLVAGRECVLFPDPGDEGQGWLQSIGTALLNAGCVVRFVPAIDEDLDKRLRRYGDKSAAMQELMAGAVAFGGAVPQKAMDADEVGAFDSNGRPIPLGVARAIIAKHPSLVSVQGDLYEYEGGIFQQVEPDAIDQDSVAIITNHARRSVLGDIRHLVGIESHKPSDFFDPGDTARRFIMLQNGAFDTETWELKQHSPDYRARNLLPVAYDPTATAPRCEQALEEWLPGDPATQQLLIEWLGYLLTPDLSQQKALVILNEGGSGTSTAIMAMEMLLGYRNVVGIPLTALRSDRTFPTAALEGKLLNVSPEFETGGDLDEGWIKSLISGDTVQVERKGRDPKLMHSTARFVVRSNNPPRLNDKTEGIWRRLLVVRFPRPLAESEQDKELPAKLAAELPGILNLALRGLQSLRRRGRFEITDSMIQERDSYRRDCNPLAVWRDECLEAAEPDYMGRAARLPGDVAYRSYRDWCRDNGHTSYSRNKFTRELQRLGVKSLVFRDESNRVCRGFEGVRLT